MSGAAVVPAVPLNEGSAPARSEPVSILLHAEGLTVESGGVAVLRNLAFALPRGRVLGLIGESGAGKSMIGRVIANQLPGGFAVAGGRLRFDGADLLKMPTEQHRGLLGRRIAFVPQEPMSALNPVATIGAHFTEHLTRLGLPRAQQTSVALGALAEMHLPGPADVLAKYPFQLSGGMCQRVLLALAFASDPELVIADEPTAALDVTTQVHIVALLRRLQQRHGTGVLFITHDLRLASHVCDDIVVLYAGEVVEYGPAAALMQRPRHAYTRALAGANPGFRGGWQSLRSPFGQMPGISEFGRMQGCRFAARCASAESACAGAVPNLIPVDGGQLIRCIRTDAEPKTEAEVADAAVAGNAGDGTPMLEIRDVSKTYTSGGWFRPRHETRAVCGVSLAVRPGEFVGIVGESGSGKSTLGRLIMGLEEPSAGEVVLNGVRLGHGPRDWDRRIDDIQLIFQDTRSALNPRRRVLSLVTQPMEAKGRARADRIARGTDLLADTGLPLEVMQRYAHQLSGGQRQRVNIARALCAMPRLLVADEIVSGLDVSVQAQILNLLLRLRREHGIALIMVSHDLAVIRFLCSRVLVMREGVVVESGPVEDVFSAPQHAYTKELIAAVPSGDPTRPWPPQGIEQDGAEFPANPPA